jgi:ElaB/YqjD/DUF883 family membrane-anchored ribosome-binding protein
MYPQNLPESNSNLADQAANSAEQAIRSTQRMANEKLDSLAHGVQGLRDQAAPLLERASEKASALAQRGVDAVRDGSHQLRERAHRASDGTLNYIKDEPVKSMLFAAAAGALLMALLQRRNGPHPRG